MPEGISIHAGIPMSMIDYLLEQQKAKRAATVPRRNPSRKSRPAPYFSSGEEPVNEENNEFNDFFLQKEQQLKSHGGLVASHQLKGFLQVATPMGWLPQLQVEGGILGESLGDSHLCIDSTHPAHFSHMADERPEERPDERMADGWCWTSCLKNNECDVGITFTLVVSYLVVCKIVTK